MKLADTQRISYKDARWRALVHLYHLNLMELTSASHVAASIWPDNQMKAQGAGAAASRILKRMEKEGLVMWTVGKRNWGYRLTPAGRKAAQEGGAQ